MNIRRNLSAGVLVGALVFVAACGGTPPAGPAITPAAQSPGAPAGTPAQPAATPAAQPGAGHDVQDPCGLATIDEVSAALGVDAVTADEDVGGDTTYCNYRTADGTSLLATSFGRGPVSRSIYASWAADDDAVEVPGIGDGAVYVNGVLFILSGDAIVGLQPGTAAVGEMSTAEIVEALANLARAVGGRL